MKSKELMSAIVSAMAICILILTGALIVGTITSNSLFNDIAVTGTNTNETLSAVDNITNSTFAIITSHSDATCSLSNVYNATGGEILTSTNYTFYTDCNLILNSTSGYIGEDLNVTYSYSYSSGSNLAGVNVTKVGEDFGSFVTNLIAFLAVIGTIIGVVWLVFYVRRLFGKKEGITDITA